VVLGHLGELAAEGAVARPDDSPSHADPVRAGDCRRTVEVGLEIDDLAFEMGIEGELLRDDERRDEHDASSPVCREAAREVERVLGLGSGEQWHYDAPVPDRRGAPRETAGLAPSCPQIREPDHSSW
jgi:hypothetical protein